jgi:hypothetical protein
MSCEQKGIETAGKSVVTYVWMKTYRTLLLAWERACGTKKRPHPIYSEDASRTALDIFDIAC